MTTTILARPTAKPNALLRVEQLEVVYNHVQLTVQGLSLHVRDREIVAMLGTNGAGKTTTLRAISGFLAGDNAAVTNGRVLLEGRDILRRPPLVLAQQGVVLVPERDKVFATLTVEENLALVRRRGLAAEQREGARAGARAVPGARSSGTSSWPSSSVPTSFRTGSPWVLGRPRCGPSSRRSSPPVRPAIWDAAFREREICVAPVRTAVPAGELQRPLLHRPERTVVYGPFRPLPRSVMTGEFSITPKPPWFVTNRTAATTGRRLTAFAARPRWSALPAIFASALRG